MPPKLSRYNRYRGEWRSRRLVFVLLLTLGLPGCHNTCITGTFNPPQGTVQVKAGDPPPTCRVTVATSAIRVEMSPAPTCASCPPASHVEHIFVTLHGISARSSARTDADSNDWQELAPQLAERPVQVDLLGLAQPEAVALGEATVPAGVYRQIRLQLLPDAREVSGPVPEKNACGNAGFHCLMMADGRVLPFAVGAGLPRPSLPANPAPDLIIPAEHIEGGFLRLLPDTGAVLRISLAASTQLVPAGDRPRLVPVFAARLATPPPDL
jgi:hypothetical protein